MSLELKGGLHWVFTLNTSVGKTVTAKDILAFLYASRSMKVSEETNVCPLIPLCDVLTFDLINFFSFKLEICVVANFNGTEKINRLFWMEAILKYLPETFHELCVSYPGEVKCVNKMSRSVF